MSTKQRNTMNHFAAYARAEQRYRGRWVSAGEVAKVTGYAIGTARKWLNLAVAHGELQAGNRCHKNGIQHIVYGLDEIQFEINQKVAG